MVVINYPDSTCRKFFRFQDTLIGPIDPNGEYKAVQIPLSLATSQFKSRKRIYGENEVVHSDFDGTIYYYPILADCIPQPSVAYPRALSMPYLESSVPVRANYGFGCPNLGSLVHATASFTMQTLTRDGSNWILRRTMTSTLSGQSYYYKWTFYIKSWVSSTKIRIAYSYTRSILGAMAPYDYTRDARSQQIIDLEGSYSRWMPSTGTLDVDVYTTDPSVAKPVYTLAQDLAVFVDNLMNAEFPLPEIDYGELASRAVKQRKRIDTNLFEFLQDLPNIKGLIPSLKNLKSLKTHAGNFLSVKYGVLPTISDLEKIIGAFKSRIPFIDKFGNTVFNASNVAAVETQEWAYSLSQYIKVPVANEDSDFLRLIEGLDEYGFGLTLENVWDLVHYSFVIDWFVDVGGFLERIDENLRLMRFNIPYVTMSRKKVVSGELPWNYGLSTVGPIEWRYYHRWVDSHCPLPPLTLSTTPTVSNHWLEAGALLIQRAL